MASAATDTTTALSSAPNPSVFGESVILTATVSCAGFTPTGDVSFFDSATLLGTAPLTAGQATLSTSSLAVGPHTLSAVYAGDTNCAGSTWPTTSQTVNVVGTSTTLVATPNPAVAGQPVTPTATVICTGFTPTGTVTFYDGATQIGSATLNGTGQATVSNAVFVAGSHNLSASYPGDNNCAAGAGNTSLVVGASTNNNGTGTAASSTHSGLTYSGSAWDPRCLYGCPPNGFS